MANNTVLALAGVAVAIMAVYTYMCYQRIFIDPIPMAAIKASPVLLCAIIARSAGRKSYFSSLVALGLVLSAAGDVFLEFDDNVRAPKSELWFVGGLGSFLVAHLCYVGAFWSTIGAIQITRIAPFVAYVLLLMYILLPHVDQALRVPVMVYGGVIAMMGISTALRMNSIFCTSRSAQLAMLGAVSFIASDSVLAIAKFRNPVPYAKVIVIVTYYLAQIMIALSTEGGSIRPKGKAH